MTMENGLCTPPKIRNIANNALKYILPEKSSLRYKLVYSTFCNWQVRNGIKDRFSETVLLAYFENESKFKSPSTLWSMYSMLRSMINFENKIDISKYSNVIALLKNKSKGYKPKQAKVFTDDEISKFIQEAPEERYLATKVVLVFGILGACHSDEMVHLKTSDIKRFDSPNQMYMVSIPEENKTSINRSFTITNDVYFKIVEKYMSLRPTNMACDRFFVVYQNGKCKRQFIGKNKFSGAAKEIANFLNLDPTNYTGHSFRRSSTTILANAGADMLTIKRHGG